MIFDNNLILTINNIILRPISEFDVNQLTALAEDKKIWEFGIENFSDPKIFKEKWFDKAIKMMSENYRVAFLIIYKNKIIGSTSYYEIEPEDKKLTIGYTWISPEYWGTIINPTCKLLLLNYAFQVLKYNRVAFTADNLNHRSCNAILKLGAKQEGILRNHIILSSGRVRDTAVFSIIEKEWVTIKKQIKERVGCNDL